MSNSFLADLKAAISQAIHQCNNHLAIILSNSELALVMSDPAAIKSKTESNIARVSQITELLTKLSQLANIETGTSPTNLKNFFEGSLKQMEALAHSQHIQMITQVKIEGILPIPTQVFQILMQTLGYNAVNAIGEATIRKIEASVATALDEIHIQIANSGAAPEKMDYDFIFNNFFSSKKTTAGDYLGLVRSLTTLLGGKFQYNRTETMNILHLTLPTKYEK